MKYFILFMFVSLGVAAQRVELSPPLRDLSSPSVGGSIATDLNPQNSGLWQTQPDGSVVWRLTIKASKAKGLLPMFSSLVLPEGSRLEVAGASGKAVAVFAHADSRAEGTEAPVVWGASVTLTYFGTAPDRFPTCRSAM